MNEQDFLQHIKTYEHARGGLSRAEHDAMKHNILAQVTQSTHHQKIHKSPYVNRMTIAFRFAATCGIVFFVGMSTFTYASAGALPGELLYHFKVNVREPLIALTKQDGKADAYALERVSERYREITVLAQNNELTQEKGAEALSYLKKQTQSVTATTVRQKPATPTGASVTTYLKTSRDVSSTIAAHSQALAEVSASVGTEDPAIQAVVEEAQSIAKENVKTITDTTHEVIQSLPEEVSNTDVVQTISTLEEEVKTIPLAEPLPVTQKTTETLPVVDDAQTLETTLTDIDTLLAQLNVLAEQSTYTTSRNSVILSTAEDNLDDLKYMYEKAKAAKDRGDYTTALELLHKTLERYETNQKIKAVQNEITQTTQSSDSSIISSEGIKESFVTS